MSKKLVKIGALVLATSLVVIVFIQSLSDHYPDSGAHREITLIELKNESSLNARIGVKLRDFVSYDCEKIVRIGGPAAYVKNAPHPLYRIDGSWFICLDGRLAPSKNHCTILSFGINNDYSFDEILNKNYGCRVHSFDPFIEDNFFKVLRKNESTSVIEVNSKWTFYRLGVASSQTNPINPDRKLADLKISEMFDLKTILKLTGSENQVVDLFKMDIEGPEKEVFAELDMDYACKYFKQLLFETHKNMRFQDLVKLEKCFYLFRRDSRFFETMTYDSSLGPLTEFQERGGYKINVTAFENELNLAEFMFVSGEMYFVNKNFL